jgi:FkbM family methyltransferase
LLTINRGAFRLRFYPSSVSAVYWYDRNFYKAEEEFLLSYLRQNDIVIDVGANIGVLSLRAASIVGNDGRVFAIEPHRVTFGFLRGNVLLNRQFSNIDVFNLAVGEAKKTVGITNKGSDDQNEIVPNGEMKVQLDTLDNIFDKTLTCVDLLKIDVEGYEKFVLVGASEILRKTKCVYIESWEAHFTKYGYSTTDVLEILRASGFTVFGLVDSKWCEIGCPYVSKVCENLVAVRDKVDFARRTGLEIR